MLETANPTLQIPLWPAWKNAASTEGGMRVQKVAAPAFREVDTGTVSPPSFAIPLEAMQASAGGTRVCLHPHGSWSGHTAGITPRVAGDAQRAWLPLAAKEIDL